MDAGVSPPIPQFRISGRGAGHSAGIVQLPGVEPDLRAGFLLVATRQAARSARSTIWESTLHSRTTFQLHKRDSDRRRVAEVRAVRSIGGRVGEHGVQGRSERLDLQQSAENGPVADRVFE